MGLQTDTVVSGAESPVPRFFHGSCSPETFRSCVRAVYCPNPKETILALMLGLEDHADTTRPARYISLVSSFVESKQALMISSIEPGDFAILCRDCGGNIRWPAAILWEPLCLQPPGSRWRKFPRFIVSTPLSYVIHGLSVDIRSTSVLYVYGSNCLSTTDIFDK